VREEDVDHLIVHYMQPHHPFLSAPGLDKGSYIGSGDRERRKRSKTVWERLRDSEIGEDTVWHAYQANLRLVLEDVELLVENVHADCAVITSDHGNAGESGISRHHAGVYLAAELYDSEEVSSDVVDERLRDLGYLR